VRTIVGEYEGEVVELRGDEALAVFSSARLALRAAGGLIDAFAGEATADPTTPFRVGIGLDAGEAVPVEGGFRGAALNLAARLCSLAGPGEILASEGVIHLAGKLEGLAYGERGALQLKGFDNPVEVVEVRPATDRGAGGGMTPGESLSRELPIGSYLGSLPANRVVGRGAEMDRLLSLIEAVHSGAGKLIFLVGEPGAGKTRLGQEVTLHVRNRGFLIGAGRCYEPQQSVPFYPFIEALTGLYVAAPADLRRELPKRWIELARLLPALGLPVADYCGPHDQQRLFWSVTGFVQAVAQRSPVALLLDDLHWGDASSLELLQHLARHTDADRVFLLGTYRDVEVNRQHPLEGALRDLGREGLIERVEIRRLGREETRELIAAVMGEEEISNEFTDLIYRRTEGNAFFVLQVLHAMVERGDVFRKDGRWDRKTIEELSVPESVRSVVGQRLSRLASETQEILQEASVLGQTFGFDDLQAMSRRPEAALERGLDEALTAGLVREAGGDRYAFDHALTQGALHAELSSRRRRRLHLAAGGAIEALPEGKRSGREPELAWHFLEGDDPERALRWSVAAGDGAEHIYAHSDAEYHYRTALQLAVEEGDGAQETATRERLGAALSHMARYDEALESYEPVVEFYRERGDLEGEIRVMASVGWILFEQGRREEGLERLRPALEQWERTPIVSGAVASLHVALGNLYWHAGWFEGGLELLERAAELAAAVGDEGLLGMAVSRRSLFLEHLDRTDEALEAYTRSIPLLEAAGDLETLTRTYNNRSLVYASTGRNAEALSDLERALEAAQRLGDPSQVGWSLGMLATAIWAVGGDWARIKAFVDALRRLERPLRGTRASSFIAAAAWLRLVAGNDPSAVLDLERLAGEAGREGDLALWWATQSFLAQWELLQGRSEQALARFEEVLEHPGIESQHRPPLERALAQALVASGQLERADRLVTVGMTRDRSSNVAFGRWPWLTVRGRLRAAQGRWDEAKWDFEEALRISRETHRLLEEAETIEAYGEMLARKGERDAARQRLTEALSIFRRVNAGPYAERTERALADLK
jgi:tetratricopeptide (TPR) repeat protein